ncbi:MAG TPA: hypothetical protein VEX39_10630 [Thermoleophilaceae bacterium]|nr:hypothetical protein [Thermoleophilaceae bacterium]
MTQKADFNAEEWAKVVEGPLLAGMRVITSHRGGTIRETVAMSKVYAEARQQQGSSELLDALVATPPAIDPATAQAGRDKAIDGLRESLRVLQQKATPEEVDAFKGFVRDVAQATARAHKEGGFLGIGGTEISPEEQTALDEIEAALGQ